MTTRITEVVARDIRFPTSLTLDGSDAMNPNPDYSAAYVILRTNRPDGLEGHGLTFTTGRGTEICVAAINALAPYFLDADVDQIFSEMAPFWRRIVSDGQLRWLGPEKGVIHLATGAIINAVWDLRAKCEQKPLWKLLVDMTPEEIVSVIDFRYLTDVLTPTEALELLRAQEVQKGERERAIQASGYPAYTSSAGWLGYSDEKIRTLARGTVEDGFTAMKMKVGLDLDDDIRRAAIVREELGFETKVMMDANQVWDVEEAILMMKSLAQFDPWWIEEPTSPDDILGHARIRKEIAPIKVTTGEHVQNRIVFKQLFQASAIDLCQVDSCRIGGVNEVLAVVLLAAKFGIPICPHGGGLGLCEYIQHISIFDYVAVTGSLENRMAEYVDHLHEHFVHPARVENGRYLVPLEPGYSIEMKPESLEEFEFRPGSAATPV